MIKTWMATGTWGAVPSPHTPLPNYALAISDDLSNFLSPYLHHQECKWHDLDSILIASTSRVERYYSQCAVTADSSTISEDEKFRPPQLINFLSLNLHHQQCKWHDWDGVLIALMCRVERCHPQRAVTAGSWSTISEDQKTPATWVDQLHITISPPPGIQMTRFRQRFDRLDE